MIVLLSYLDKTLKKVVIRYLSKIAIRIKLINSIYFGAIARCLAVNIGIILTHNIVKLWQDSEIFTA